MGHESGVPTSLHASLEQYRYSDIDLRIALRRDIDQLGLHQYDRRGRHENAERHVHPVRQRAEPVQPRTGVLRVLPDGCRSSCPGRSLAR